jgi:hypothetical protein
MANVPVKQNHQTKVVAQPISVAALMAADAEAGVTGGLGLTAKDLAIPFISILQAQSPQVLRGPENIPGAQAGEFYNNVTGEVYTGDITVIPCSYRSALVEWRPRGADGGYVREHLDESELGKCTKNDNNQDMLPNGNLLVRTQYHYVLVVKATGSVDRAVIPLSRTQLKKGLRWNQQIVSLQVKLANGRIINPPRYSHKYTARSAYDSNPQGAWYGWDFGSPKLIDDAQLYALGKKFSGEVSAGSVKVSIPTGESSVSTEQPGEEVF